MRPLYKITLSETPLFFTFAVSRENAPSVGSAARTRPVPSLFPASTVNRPMLAPTSITSRRSEEHTSELQSLMRISYAVFCLQKKTKENINTNTKNAKNTKTKTQELEQITSQIHTNTLIQTH